MAFVCSLSAIFRLSFTTRPRLALMPLLGDRKRIERRVSFFPCFSKTFCRLVVTTRFIPMVSSSSILRHGIPLCLSTKKTIIGLDTVRVIHAHTLTHTRLFPIEQKKNNNTYINTNMTTNLETKKEKRIIFIKSFLYVFNIS